MRPGLIRSGTAKSSILPTPVDRSEFAAFVDECGPNAPWLWKDPRLWVTMGFWKHLLPADTARPVLRRREPLQAWISCTLRRQIQTFGYLRRYNASTEG